MRVKEERESYSCKLREFDVRCRCGRLLGIEFSDIFKQPVTTEDLYNMECDEDTPSVTCIGCHSVVHVTKNLIKACEEQGLPYHEIYSHIGKIAPARRRQNGKTNT